MSAQSQRNKTEKQDITCGSEPSNLVQNKSARAHEAIQPHDLTGNKFYKKKKIQHPTPFTPDQPQYCRIETQREY